MTEDDRKRMAALAAERFEKASADIAAEGRFGGPAHASTEIEIMDEAAQLVAEAKAARSLSDAISKAIPRVREMGDEEIAETHAAGQPVFVSDGRGGVVRIDPDGTRSSVP
jgi:hypothetical protein